MDQNWIQEGLHDGLKTLIVGVFAWAGGVFWSNWRKATKEEVAEVRRALEDLKTKQTSHEMAQLRIESKLDNKMETIFAMLAKIEHQLERIQSSE